MKIIDEIGRFRKDTVYDFYSSIIYDIKSYDNITRKNMVEEIIKQYNISEYLYHICTGRELEFLKYSLNNKISKNDHIKYQWEIKELNKKCIFSRSALEVFEDQKENVKDALDLYEKKNDKKLEDHTVTFIVGFVKTQAVVLEKVFISLLKSLIKKSETEINAILGHPLIHFYCGFFDQESEYTQKKETYIYFRDYYNLLDDLEEQRKEYAIAGTMPFDVKLFIEIFYYDMPISIPYVKKLYNKICKSPNKNFYFHLINESRILYTPSIIDTFVKDRELLLLIYDALDDTPCAAMNGFTPKQWRKENKEAEKNNDKILKVPQNNANLCKKDADLYYKLYFGLLDYTNAKHHISSSLKKIYKQTNINPEELMPVDKYFWGHKEKLINNYIKDNPHDFSDEELKMVVDFKKSITSHFTVVGFDREYSLFLSDDGKIYMVKGIRSNIDEIIPPESLPTIIETTILMFKDKIIFSAMLSRLEVSYGNKFTKAVLLESKKAIKYYHL